MAKFKVLYNIFKGVHSSDLLNQGCLKIKPLYSVLK